jgi:acyl-coenzyme A synthetase/AMP-(fatty) acid ligase
MTSDGSAADDRAVLLAERDADALLFRRAGEPLTAARFLRDVQRVAADLPEADHCLNLCQDRYAFTVALAAAALRGQVSLLSSDRSPASRAGLNARFERVIAVAETQAADIRLRHHVLTLPHDPVTGPPPNPVLPADRLIAIVFTSGSTGTPVGYRKTWGALTERSRAAGLRFGMHTTAPAGIVGTVPPQHMYGFETTVLLPLHAMAASWSGPAFYPIDIRDALLAMPAPRVLVTTPLQIRALLDNGMTLPPLQSVISATAPLDPALAAAAEKRWTAPVLEIFGATEVGSIASRRTVAGPVWTTYDGIRLLPAGTDQVLIAAPHAEPHPLADRVEALSPAEFNLLGRNADMVKLGGRRASLGGLNAILLGLPGVVDGVFIAPDDLDKRPGARLLAFAVSPDLSPEDILSALRERIEPVFLPRRVIRVDSLPRNDAGKIPRAALMDLLAKDAGVR